MNGIVQRREVVVSRVASVDVELTNDAAVRSFGQSCYRPVERGKGKV